MISVKVMELSFGLTDANTSANGRLVSSMASAPTSAKKATPSKENGRTAARSGGSTTTVKRVMRSKNLWTSTESNKRL